MDLLIICNDLTTQLVLFDNINLTLRRHEKINEFQNVEKQFIPSVLYPFTAPTDLSCDLNI